MQEVLPAHRSGFARAREAPRLGLQRTHQPFELSAAELRDGAARLLALAEEHQPRFVAIAGVTAYRTAFARPRAAIGPQDDDVLGPARLWILPNPSGLNAHWTLPALADAFRQLRVAAGDG